MACRRICTVCCRQQAPYTCPRCLKLYCSTTCYKNHSQTCSESFYREEATAQLKATKAGPEQTRHMLEVLQRLHQQQENDGALSDTTYDGDSSAESEDGSDELTCHSAAHSGEDTAAPLHSTGRKLSPALRQLLQRAQQQGEDCFDVLESDITAEVVRELEELNCKGQLSHLIAPWSPWWDSEAAAAVQLNPAGQQVVQEIQEVDQQLIQEVILQQPLQQINGVEAAKGSSKQWSISSNKQGMPRPCEQPLPTLQLLAGKTHKPSPLLPWQLLQLLVAYTAVLRKFNGEPDTDGSWEAAQHLILLAPPLVQSALTSSQATQQAQPQSQQQEQQQQQLSVLPPPDSVRCACMQLLDAAAVACHITNQGLPVNLLQQIMAAAAAVSSSASAAVAPETWTLLQVAETDALKLLQLGRSAVLLALADARRMLTSARDSVRAQLQDTAGEGGQKQKHRPKRQLQQTKHIFGLTVQKLWYLMVWSNEQAPTMYQCLAHELDRELQGQHSMSQTSSGVSLTACKQPSRRPPPAWQPLIEVAKTTADSNHSSVECAQRVSGSGLYGLD